MNREYSLENTRNHRYYGTHRWENHHNRKNLFYTGRSHKLGETHEAPPPWTGWNKSRKEAHYFCRTTAIGSIVE